MPILNPLLSLPSSDQKPSSPRQPLSPTPKEKKRKAAVSLSDWWGVFNIYYPNNISEWWKALGGFELLGLDSSDFYKTIYSMNLSRRNDISDQQLFEWANGLRLRSPRPDSVLRGESVRGDDGEVKWDKCFVVPSAAATDAANNQGDEEGGSSEFLLNFYKKSSSRKPRSIEMESRQPPANTVFAKVTATVSVEGTEWEVFCDERKEAVGDATEATLKVHDAHKSDADAGSNADVGAGAIDDDNDNCEGSQSNSCGNTCETKLQTLESQQSESQPSESQQAEWQYSRQSESPSNDLWLHSAFTPASSADKGMSTRNTPIHYSSKQPKLPKPRDFTFEVLKSVGEKAPDNGYVGKNEILDEMFSLAQSLHNLESTQIEPTVRKLVKSSMVELTKDEDAKKADVIMKRYLEYETKQQQDCLVEREREEEDMNAHCIICYDGEVTLSNQIVFCEGCNVAVHQECYGVPVVPEGDWYCRVCESGRTEVKCALCPIKKGAFVPTVQPDQWVHVSCAKWHGMKYVPAPKVSHTTTSTTQSEVGPKPKAVESQNSTEVIEDLSHLKQHFRVHLKNRMCVVCDDNYGAMNKCEVPNCDAFLHVTCARESLGCLVVHGEDCNGLTKDGWRLRCPKHSKGKIDTTAVPLDPSVRYDKFSLSPNRLLNNSERHLAMWEEDELKMSVTVSKIKNGAFCDVCNLRSDNSYLQDGDFFRCHHCGVFVHSLCYRGLDLESEWSVDR